MDNENFTIPKNIILNWLYSAQINVPLGEFGSWLEHISGGKYRLIELQASSNEQNNSLIAHDQ